jgi:hypothetical protein
MKIDIDIDYKDFSDSILKQLENACQESLTDTTEYLLKQANLTIPYDTGRLKRSGQTSVDKKSTSGYVSYDTEYALRVHESTGRRFNQKGINLKNPNVKRRRRAKWLQKTLVERNKNIMDRISKTFKRYL